MVHEKNLFFQLMIPGSSFEMLMKHNCDKQLCRFELLAYHWLPLYGQNPHTETFLTISSFMFDRRKPYRFRTTRGSTWSIFCFSLNATFTNVWLSLHYIIMSDPEENWIHTSTRTHQNTSWSKDTQQNHHERQFSVAFKTYSTCE